MSAPTLRQQAVLTACARQPRALPARIGADGRPLRLSQLFGQRTFSAEEMRRRLSPDILGRWQATVERGAKLEREVAEAIAHAVKEWALERGATHFCHWFHPMTGATAEKHDSFLAFDREGRAIEKLNGAMLIQSEPDASSFPSGGMRSTFEARGYTAWDPTSPMFLIEGAAGSTLVIPSAFIGYHGQALDEKAPLLRSMEALSQAAVDLLELLGHQGVSRVTATVGPEQEYFLIDRAWLASRSDLLIAGRSLQGARPPKGQTLEDHYFGSIPPRVLAFMEEVEGELHALGVSAKTRHNEVAPMQFELAPIFAEANLAADHNQLVMLTLRKVAARHELALLLHEKPFAGVNGSGKHVNWSMSTSQGENLLDPGHNTPQNLRFLAFLAAVLLGVSRHGALLRASIASHGNDFRLGANEAPPAIISVFLGDFLSELVGAIAEGRLADLPAGEALLNLGTNRLATIAQDNTDRNRTSPFAFTGNKFEFRAVGASASISFPTAVVNTVVADGICQIAAWIREDGGPEAPMAAIRRALVESTAVRFDGNGYSAEWVEEAERRGLPHARNTPAALAALATPEAELLFGRHDVLSAEELHSRYEVRVEQYNKKVDIERELLCELVDTLIWPAAVAEGFDVEPIGEEGPLLRRQRRERAAFEELGLAREAVDALEGHCPAGGEAARAEWLAAEVVPALLRLRLACDAVEALMPDASWPLPKYREMLFLV